MQCSITDKSNISLSTGNEYLSLSNITLDGGIKNIGFINKAYRAGIEMQGSTDYPLLRPFVEVDGKDLFEDDVKSDVLSFWIPNFEAANEKISAKHCVFAPLDRRGFVCVLTLENKSSSDIEIKTGWKGCWLNTYHLAKVADQMLGHRTIKKSSIAENVTTLDFRDVTPIFAMALLSNVEFETYIEKCSSESENRDLNTVSEPIYYSFSGNITIRKGQKITIPLYAGVGIKEVSAVSSAQEMKLQGWDKLQEVLVSWLNAHTIRYNDSFLNQLINVNSFYNYFFSQALTLDSEEHVITSARTSSNNSSMTYSDRDAMRWSLPAILQMNWAQARRLLIYGFTNQLQNVGSKSRYVDGVILEPGFALDGLCAPIRALQTYVQLTDDLSILFDRRVQVGVNTIQQILAAQRHPELALFETLLMPSGEYSKLPYVCYSNVVVWRALLDISMMYNRIRDMDRSDEAKQLANKVKSAIMQYFVVNGPFGEMFACSIDSKNNYELGDDPMGSLQLLTYLRFCSPGDTIYRNTVQWIHSEQNPDCGRYCAIKNENDGNITSLDNMVMSVVNDLLSGRKDRAVDFLKKQFLDETKNEMSAIACMPAMGTSYASMAGYLAFGLRVGLDAPLPSTSQVKEKKRPSETLYEPPPETRHDTKKARL